MNLLYHYTKSIMNYLSSFYFFPHQLKTDTKHIHLIDKTHEFRTKEFIKSIILKLDFDWASSLTHCILFFSSQRKKTDESLKKIPKANSIPTAYHLLTSNFSASINESLYATSLLV